jgi:hypothetical protein
MYDIETLKKFKSKKVELFFLFKRSLHVRHKVGIVSASLHFGSERDVERTFIASGGFEMRDFSNH